ncbi:MAG TPA: hypothetical protein VNX02_08275 [Steroidobacteraceae bacterium]|jgi:hypothetical protein|nr:hypothetical protein [Steroidobacteraceae bacterium]
MTISRPVSQAVHSLLGLVLLASTLLASGCVVEPREGFYDRDHHRWYHEHGWHDCGEHDEHCHD